MAKSKLPPRSGCSLVAVEPHPQKGAIKKRKINTASKVSKYRVICGPHFRIFSPNTGKYGPGITPYWDTFHAVKLLRLL